MLVLVCVITVDVFLESRMISIAASNTAGMNVAEARATHCLPTPHNEHIAPHTPLVSCIQLQLSHCVRHTDADADDDAEVDAYVDVDADAGADDDAEMFSNTRTTELADAAVIGCDAGVVSCTLACAYLCAAWMTRFI